MTACDLDQRLKQTQREKNICLYNPPVALFHKEFEILPFHDLLRGQRSMLESCLETGMDYRDTLFRLRRIRSVVNCLVFRPRIQILQDAFEEAT